MPNHDEYPIERAGGVWDRIWRGRSSSHRRALTNAALHAARCATALRDAARLIDETPGDRRSAEIAGLAQQVIDLSERMRACGDHLNAEAGFVPPAARRGWFWWLRG